MDWFSIGKKLEKISTIKLKSTPKRAAVLVAFCEFNREPSLLYNLRSVSVGSHKGQASFPGGKEEEGDQNNMVTTALRECEEEMGLSRTIVNVFGIYHEMLSLNRIAVTPVVALITTDISQITLTPNEEIEKIFTVPLLQLKDINNWTEEELDRGIFPRFSFNNVPSIWGLTGILTYKIMKDLVGMNSSLPGIKF